MAFYYSDDVNDNYLGKDSTYTYDYLKRNRKTMTQHSGRVSHVQKNDHGWFWFILDGEEKLYYRMKKKSEGLQKGDNVQFNYELTKREANGTIYDNLDVDVDTIKKVEAPAPSTKSNGKASHSSSGWDVKDMRIRYAGALNTATSLVLFLVEHGHIKVGAKAKNVKDMGVLEATKSLIHKVADDYYQAITVIPERDWEEEEAPPVVLEAVDAEDDDGFDDD